jgi:hypothetical protein
VACVLVMAGAANEYVGHLVERAEGARRMRSCMPDRTKAGIKLQAGQNGQTTITSAQMTMLHVNIMIVLLQRAGQSYNVAGTLYR